VFITAGPIIKPFAWREGNIGGHVLRETTSRGLCGLVCPSCTSERGGEGDCVKEGGGGGEQWRTCATRDYEPRPVWTSLPITHWGCYYATGTHEMCVCVYYCRT
jgi:hypothetical protein